MSAFTDCKEVLSKVLGNPKVYYSLPLHVGVSGSKHSLHIVKNLRIMFDSPKTQAVPQYRQGTDSRTQVDIKIQGCSSTLQKMM